MDTPTDTPAPPPPPPWVYGIFFLPFGAAGAFISVTLAWIAARAGLSDMAVASLYAAFLAPHTLKVLWGPLVDAAWSPRGWFLLSDLLASAAVLALGVAPVTGAGLPALQALAFAAGLATTFVSMSSDALMAHFTPPDLRGRAAGWSQAGNLGGMTLGGLALLLAQQVEARWVPAGATALCMLACGLPLLRLSMPVRPIGGDGVRAAGRALALDLKAALWSRTGLVSIALCLLPIGSGGAGALFSAMADEWHASPEVVSLANGLAAAVLAYHFSLGLVFATFTGFVLEAIGRGAAATKYNLLASLSNVPIYGMTVLDGWVAEAHGRTAMLVVDGLSGLFGAALLLALVMTLRRRG